MRLILIALLLIGCSKDKCYDCTVTTITGNNTITTVKEFCGSVDDVNDFQNAGTFTTFDKNGNIINQSYTNCQ